MLGTPGLFNAYRAGNVTLANAVGAGIADDKSTYPFVPEMIRFYLGESPILANVADLSLCRAGRSPLCARSSRRAGGERDAWLGRLRHADWAARDRSAEREAFAARLKARPADYIAQPTLALSTCPTFVESGIAPRHVDLRPFVLCR